MRDSLGLISKFQFGTLNAIISQHSVVYVHLIVISSPACRSFTVSFGVVFNELP